MRSLQADIEVPLGSTQRVTQLFAYPNNCNVICFRPWTLEQSRSQHYLNQSVQRDGYSRAKVSVKVHDGLVAATFSGVPDSYGQPLTALLDTPPTSPTKAPGKLNSDG